MAKTKKTSKVIDDTVVTTSSTPTAEVVKTEAVAAPAAEIPASSTTNAKVIVDIDGDNTLECNAYVVSYRTAAQRAAHLTELGRKVEDNEKKWGEARVVIEGRMYWVKLAFGKVFPGTRLHVTYLKDENGDIVRSTIVAHSK